jgi:hypothetical protein
VPEMDIYRCLLLDQDCRTGFITEHLRGLIWIYNVCGVKLETAWALLMIKSF